MFCSLLSVITLFICLCFPFFFTCIVGDVVVKVYYEEFPKGCEYFPIKLKECMERAMDQIKDHYFASYKHLPICDPTLGPNFLKEIQVHYNMNFKPEMFIAKLQMLVFSCLIPYHKFVWIKQWNKSSVL